MKKPIRCYHDLEANKKIGLRLLQIRVFRDLNRKQLAGLIGLNVQQIQRIETGITLISSEMLAVILKVLKISTTEFFQDF